MLSSWDFSRVVFGDFYKCLNNNLVYDGCFCNICFMDVFVFMIPSSTKGLDVYINKVYVFMVNYVVGVVCSAPGICFMVFYPQPLGCCYECYEWKISHHQLKITFFCGLSKMDHV